MYKLPLIVSNIWVIYKSSVLITLLLSISMCLFLSSSLHLSLPLHLYPSPSLSISLHLSICGSLSVPLPLSQSLSISLFPSFSLHLSVCRSARRSWITSLAWTPICWNPSNVSQSTSCCSRFCGASSVTRLYSACPRWKNTRILVRHIRSMLNTRGTNVNLMVILRKESWRALCRHPIF